MAERPDSACRLASAPHDEIDWHRLYLRPICNEHQVGMCSCTWQTMGICRWILKPMSYLCGDCDGFILSGQHSLPAAANKALLWQRRQEVVHWSGC